MKPRREKIRFPRWPGILCCGALSFIVLGSSLSAQPITPPPGPGDLVNGGSYRGPGDLVPPNLPPFDPDTDPACQGHDPAICDQNLLPKTSCPACDLPPGALEWEPWQTSCVGCSDEEEPSTECFLASGYNLTFGELKELCNQNIDCSVPTGNITVCIDDPQACEVHVLESAWINTELRQGKGICSPVPIQACLNGQPLFTNPHSIDIVHRGTGSCSAAEVCITFPRDCMCAAIDRWDTVLQQSTVYDDKWILHVAFTHCEGCGCDGDGDI